LASHTYAGHGIFAASFSGVGTPLAHGALCTFTNASGRVEVPRPPGAAGAGAAPARAGSPGPAGGVVRLEGPLTPGMIRITPGCAFPCCSAGRRSGQPLTVVSAPLGPDQREAEAILFRSDLSLDHGLLRRSGSGSPGSASRRTAPTWRSAPSRCLRTSSFACRWATPPTARAGLNRRAACRRRCTAGRWITRQVATVLQVRLGRPDVSCSRPWRPQRLRDDRLAFKPGRPAPPSTVASPSEEAGRRLREQEGTSS
jgi:hypothetical protein